MAQIVINEISQNYTYNIGSNSFATVALPITAMWGPAYMEPPSTVPDEAEDGETKYDYMLEHTKWLHFPATQQGLEQFVSTYRGPSTNYRAAEDYSYQMAMTLLTAGYDVLVCRVCPGSKAFYTEWPELPDSATGRGTVVIRAKHPGSFGNNLSYKITGHTSGYGDNAKPYWNIIVYVTDSANVRTAVENLNFVFDINNATDNIPHVSELISNFILIETELSSDEMSLDAFHTAESIPQSLYTGTDTNYKYTTVADAWEAALNSAKLRYLAPYGAGYEESTCEYIKELKDLNSVDDKARAQLQAYKEWVYSAAYNVYGLLKDKLNYNPQRIISPGWDDQNICDLKKDSTKIKLSQISPLHQKLMDVSYYSRCGTSLLDVPKSLKRSAVHNPSAEAGKEGYAQMLARIVETLGVAAAGDVNTALYTTHSAFFAPWGQYKYVGMGKQYPAPPSFLALLMQRAMILNQSLQYEWALPTNRKHNLRIGKMDYEVPKKLLDVWQKLDGVGVNVLTEIPDLGLSIWGNSTLYEVPVATYQALANLSTRYLVNAVEDIAYKCGLVITFQYNNEQAYNKFYAGVTPTLDTMKNVGAIDDYYVKMAADINGLDQVNANTVIGKIYLVINGVINDIIIDLIALPPGTDLNQYKS